MTTLASDTDLDAQLGERVHTLRHMHVDAVGKAMRRALGFASSAHALRHRFATRAYAGTHDLLAVQRLLGHASPATTQIYVAVSDDALRAAVAAAA